MKRNASLKNIFFMTIDNFLFVKRLDMCAVFLMALVEFVFDVLRLYIVQDVLVKM